MSQQLQEKISQAINDFRCIVNVVNLIDHEMEKRIIARHVCVKLDALIVLLPQLKNKILKNILKNDNKKISKIDNLIRRLRKDYKSSEMKRVRDAMTAHALHMDLVNIVISWKVLGRTFFSILSSDLDEIEAELITLDPAYLPLPLSSIDPNLKNIWNQKNHLDDPSKIRMCNLYQGLGTAGIVSVIPNTSLLQDVMVRANGLAIFMRQVRIVLIPVDYDTVLERNLAEILLNDYLAFWELLFVSKVLNRYGISDLCVLDHWKNDGWGGANCLEQLQKKPHPDLEKWRLELRNKYTAHIDPKANILFSQVQFWPVNIDDLIVECFRVINAVNACAQLDVRSQHLFVPPQIMSDVVGLSNQEGRRWADA